MPRLLIRLGVWSFALSILASASQAAEAEPLVFTPEQTVLLEGPGSSAALLQYYLLRYYASPEAAEPFALTSQTDRATSPTFPVLRDTPQLEPPAGKSIIAVGNTRFLSEADKARLAAEPGSILLKRQGNVVIVAGEVADATSEFLNRVAGIRSYAPDEIWTSRPDEKQFTVNQLELFRPRYFATSWLAPYWKRNAEWVRMNPSAGRLAVTSYHNLAGIFPPEKYAATHPEIYEMRGGERRVPGNVGTRIWNPCLSAKVLPDLAMEYVRETMKARPGSKYIAMGMMDIDFDCQCEDCQRSVKEHGGSYSNLYYTLLNEVARRCQKEYPGLLVTSLLYSNARTPPVGMQLEPNIVVKVVTKTYSFVNPKAWEAERRRIEAFSALGASWMIHDWSFSGVSPRSYMHQYARFLQWAKQNNMIGAYIEYSPGESWYLDGAKYWILTQLMNDPYQDVDLLWKTYCDDMFGAASETMYRFHQHFQDKFVYAPDLITLADLPRQEPAMYTADDLAYQRKLLEQAIAQTADDALAQARLAKVMQYFRAHELFAQATHTPHRLHHGFQGEGINQPLLAFYVQDDGAKLDEAIRYYHEERTVAPDDNYMEVRLALPISYVNNYTRGFADLLRKIRTQALESVDLSQVQEATVAKIVSESHGVLQANLPAEALPERVKLLKGILGKTLWIPTVEESPQLDGDLSDAAWAKAVPLVDFTERDTLRTPKHATEGKIMRVGDKLLIGLKCQQTGGIWTQSPKETLTGTHIWRESGIEVFYGPVGQGDEPPPYAQYVINAQGAFRGFGTAKNNREGVEVETRLDAAQGVYVIEASLPLKGPEYDYTQEKMLTFNIGRMVYTRDSYESEVILGWYPIFTTVSDPASRSLVFFP